jgi:chromosome segregation protein
LKHTVRRLSRLKALELQGYKTFVNKNTFDFAPTITAFVGPNGSGKSNIADSIRWVLGEQSYTLLRAKRTEDMIFSGSETRPRSSMASASIVFDNEDGWLPIDFTEVTISRRAYRDGLNEYLLNGQKVRLRDVSELLAQCGLSQRTYTIIGQGLVDAALSLNPEKRRRLFEEAAGISLYRNRKQEALRRLDATRRNLERVQDILIELRPRLRSLERQAKRAKDYDQIREDLKAVMRVWYGYHWYRLLDSVTLAQKQAGIYEQERNDLRQKQIDAEQRLSETRTQIDSLRTRLQQWSHELSNLYRTRETVGKVLAVSQERNRWLTDQDRTLDSEIASLEDSIGALDLRIKQINQEIHQNQAQIVQVEEALGKLGLADGEGASQKLSHEVDVRRLKEQIESTVTQEATKTVQVEQLSEQLRTSSLRLEKTRSKLRDAEGEGDRIKYEEQENLSQHQQAQRIVEQTENQAELAYQQLETIQSNKQSLTSQRSQLETKQATLRARSELIRQAAEQPTAVIEAIKDGLKRGRLSGLAGRFWDKLQVQAGYETAISAALGDFRAALAFWSIGDLEKVIKELEESDARSRASFLSVSPLRTAPGLEMPVDPNCLGVATQFVEAPQAYHSILDLLLGRTLVAKDSATALGILADLPLDVRIVTLSGNLFYPAGLVILDADMDGRRGMPSLQSLSDELNKVEGALEKIEQAIRNLEEDEASAIQRQEQLKEKLKVLQQELNASQLKLEKCQFERKASEAKLETLRSTMEEVEQERSDAVLRLSSLEHEAQSAERMRMDLELVLQKAIREAQRSQPAFARVQEEARLELARKGLEDLGIRLNELTNQRTAMVQDLDLRKARRSSTLAEHTETDEEARQREGELATLEERIGEIESEIHPQEEALAEAENLRMTLERAENQARADLRIAERTHSQAQIDLARLEEELSSLKRRIEDDFGLVTYEYYEEGISDQDPLPFEDYVEYLSRVDDLPDQIERQVNRLRSQLRRMGVVNPEATKEYEAVRSRVDFLKTQLEDSRQAEAQIQDVIGELDLLMEREFRKTYDSVAAEFRDTFTRLFGGGSARLTLTDDTDLTSTGIDIEARLPGRREQGLAMLSGGERSLTACSLIFALMKVSPTPFCVMDEVDAMLDDANVLRFIEMLHELSTNTQFVLITHNRQTVQVAEVIYGVTMRSDSTSQVISLKLDEAEEAIAR